MEASEYWIGPPPEASTVGSPEYAMGLWGSIAFLIVTMWVIERGDLDVTDDQTDEAEGGREPEPVQTTK